MKGITSNLVLLILFIGMTLAANANAFDGRDLVHTCLDPANSEERIQQRDDCSAFADTNGYRIGVLRPCDQGDVLCAQASVCPEPGQINFVCVGHAAYEGNCVVNEDCAEGSFCRKLTGFCQGRGVCEERPMDGGCPSEIDLVCGCDNTTYNNSCEAAWAKVSLKSTGECQ